MFGQSIAVFAALGGPEHLVETANPAFFSAIGEERARTGVAIAELMPELAGQGFIALLDQVYRTGEPYTGRDVRVVLGAGPHTREAFFDFTYEPRRDADGDVTGIRVIGVETTQVKHAQRLMAEHHALLEQIARQAPLTEVLDGMARCIENLAPQEILVSVLLADSDGRHLRHGAAPSLPDFYNEAIDGIATGEGVGSCGTAAHRREPVIVTDIATDPFWDDFRDLAGRAGLAACWSTPILARDGGLLGTFAMYHRTPRVPQDTDLALARVFAGTAALAIERHHIEQGKLAAEARAKAAHDELTKAVRAERELRAEAEQRAAAAAELAAQMRAAAAAQAAAPHPEHCQLGGVQGCTAPAEIKIADSWGDSAWGCSVHVEEAILNVRSVFIASEALGGLAAYLNR
ncbi:GAF domain-containing protein [Micromonospora sp. NPDC047812]|uniref:GAF domain-containing protein n=1 Tax=Micromonospora sp. NPDC047812 TaxID=3155742 RepID=UPI003452CBC5